MLHKTLFHELTGVDSSDRPEKIKPLTPDTVNYFFNENGHVMEYYEGENEKIIALFFGPWEFVLPSHVDYSRFTVFDGDKVGIFTYRKVIRGLRRDPWLADMYRVAEEVYRKKVADRIYVARHFTARERFDHLMATQPWVLELAEKEDVANYLGVEVWELRAFL